MTEVLADDYTVFLEPLRGAPLREELAGEYEGIGIWVEHPEGSSRSLPRSLAHPQLALTFVPEMSSSRQTDRSWTVSKTTRRCLSSEVRRELRSC